MAEGADQRAVHGADRLIDITALAELRIGGAHEDRIALAVHGIGGVELATTKELVKNIGRIKKKGMKRAAIAFAPPPRVVSFTKRPLGLL